MYVTINISLLTQTFIVTQDIFLFAACREGLGEPLEIDSKH